MIAVVSKIKGFEFDVDVEFYHQGEFIVAYSPDLDLSTYSKTLEGAKSSFEDALKVFLTETLEKRTFFSELESLGWRIKLVPVLEFIKPTQRPKQSTHADVIDHTQFHYQFPI